MALGVIAPLCASLSPVLAGPQGCSRGRWRSGPSKWRHTAALGGRGQGAPRTCRCIETLRLSLRYDNQRAVREHHAPVGALRQLDLLAEQAGASGQGAPRTCRCIETRRRPPRVHSGRVREHHAPVGALRRVIANAYAASVMLSGSTTQRKTRNRPAGPPLSHVQSVHLTGPGESPPRPKGARHPAEAGTPP